jgi:phosphopantothenoylcysteine decarboxylase/phosphopantothenate--cysteine ligase
MLQGKTVLLGVTGSIAAYKAAALASSLVKHNCNVHVLMTKNATRFVTPMTFETLTGNKAPYDSFNRNFFFDVEHIELAKKADLIMIAPATANMIAKLSAGIADDILSTTALACRCKKMAAPAMNVNMYENPVTVENLQRLAGFGWEIIAPGEGRLACGDKGVGKLAEPEILLSYIINELAFEKDLKGLKVLVTAGPTREGLDPVRFISNNSSGKMGYALALAAANRGAEVTLISGKTALDPPLFVTTLNVLSAQDMFDAVTAISDSQDIIIKAAAVADYRPAIKEDCKIKKAEESMEIPLLKTSDILQYLGDHRKKNQFLCGFSMETEDLIENSRRKLFKKHLDMIAANNLKDEGAGFSVDTNRLTLITKQDISSMPLLTKQEAAHKILDRIMEIRTSRHED